MEIPIDIFSIRDYLQDLECCRRCILKYLKYSHTNDTYLNPEKHVIFSNTNAPEEANQHKKVKTNPCRSCLDIFTERSMKSYLDALPPELETFKIDSYKTSVSFPLSMICRQYSMLFDLKIKFPSVYKDIAFSDLEDSKLIYKIATSERIANSLSKKFSPKSIFEVMLTFEYEDDEKECAQFQTINPKFNSKTNVMNYLKVCNYDEFKSVFPVPPEIQNKNVRGIVTCFSSGVYLGGRYLKFSRDMGQTPFIVGNIRVTESSVQEQIYKAIKEVLWCDESQLVFTSSGREDCDTRVVGNGRPFYIHIKDSKFNVVTAEQCRKIEELIARSNSVVVIRLRQVSPGSIHIIKQGEESKNKAYLALCKTASPDINRVLGLINCMEMPLVINQKTPIRVLHRRSQMSRVRSIYEMKATHVEGSSELFYLTLTTQAGTYVKELVHGDFNRTMPNLSDVTGYPVDVVALDVTRVELEWPPNESYSY